MLLLFALYVFTLALTSLVRAAGCPGKQAAHPVPATVLQSRQVTREKLLLQRERKERIRRGELRPRSSDKPYQTCSAATTTGYAVFPGYDYVGHDFERAWGEQNEALCADRCAATDGCVGYTYMPDDGCPCYAKLVANDNSALVKDAASSTGGVDTGLLGSCASLAQYCKSDNCKGQTCANVVVDADKMADCCDSFDAYPTCSVASVPGYARFPQWDYTDETIDTETVDTEADCISLCKDNDQCSSVFFWAAQQQCDLKGSSGVPDAFDDTTPGAMASGSVYDALGSCNYVAAQGDPSSPYMSVCCNTK